MDGESYIVFVLDSTETPGFFEQRAEKYYFKNLNRQQIFRFHKFPILSGLEVFKYAGCFRISNEKRILRPNRKVFDYYLAKILK